MTSNRSILSRWTSATTLSLRVAFILFGVSLLIGTLGFMLIEDYGFVDAFYMSVITLSTVGFSEVKPLGEGGKLFVSLYIIFNVGIFTYAISAFSAYVLQGSFLKRLNFVRMEKAIASLEGHTIICGLGRHGREMIDHFDNHNNPYVVIDLDAEKLAKQFDEKTLLSYCWRCDSG